MKPVRFALAWLVCAAALLMVGCAPGIDGVRQSISVTSRVVASGYRALGVYDKTRQGSIRAAAQSDPRAADAQLIAHLAKYDTAAKALDTAADAIDAAVRFERLLEQGAVKSKDVPLWIANLAAAALSVTQALQDLGVI